MNIEYRGIDDKDSDFEILLTCLFELIKADTRKRYVLQSRMILFCILNGYISKRQFLILCRKYDIYGGGGTPNEFKLAQSYTRRFFSEKCQNGIFIKRERAGGTGSKKDVIYTAGAKARDKLKKTLPLCDIGFSCNVYRIIDALLQFYPKRRQWYEPAHYSHMLAIGDFMAVMAVMGKCTRFIKEISIANGASILPGVSYQILCSTVAHPFRADSYVKLKLESPDVTTFQTSLKEDSLKEIARGNGTYQINNIEILYEQDTGSQRKDILSSKLENYSHLFYALSSEGSHDELFCLLFSCLNDLEGNRKCCKKDLQRGQLEAEFIDSLRNNKGMDNFGTDKEKEADINFKAFLKEQLGVSESALKKIYSELVGASCILKTNSIMNLSHIINDILLEEAKIDVKIGCWNEFLKFLCKYGHTDNLSEYAVLFSVRMECGVSEGHKIPGTYYALYHQCMKNFIKRREIIREGMIKQPVFRKAALLGHTVCAVPGYHMVSLLPSLFPGVISFQKQFKSYLNVMYFGIRSFYSYELLKKDAKGTLLNYFKADTFCGLKGFYVENMSLDLTARMRLAFYLKDYALHPEEYEKDHWLLIFFLSDDLPSVRELALDLKLYYSYENGYLKERSLLLERKNMFEVLFVCIEDMQDNNRWLPAITFDRQGCGHYKFFLSEEGPKLFDIPNVSMRVDIPVEIDF